MIFLKASRAKSLTVFQFFLPLSWCASVTASFFKMILFYLSETPEVKAVGLNMVTNDQGKLWASKVTWIYCEAAGHYGKLTA